jgi:arsenate reductase
MLKVYTYSGCSTCKSATKWLKANGVAFDEKPIRETPPSVAELKAMLKARGDLKPLFNTSGQDYRAMGIKDKLADMSEADALKLLSEHGNLVKRPFALDKDTGVYLVGFKEDEWANTLK